MYETKAGVPTRGDTFARLVHHLREAQDHAAMLAHLYNADGDAKGMTIGRGWLRVEDMLKRMIHTVTEIAKGYVQ